MKIKPEHAFLFRQTGARNWLERDRSQRPNALFPRTMTLKPAKTDEYFIYADDPGMLRVSERLVARYNSAFKPDVLPNGFAGPTAVPGTFDALLNVSGCGMDPLPIPISNNGAFVKANGCVSSIRPQDAPWLDELIRLFFGHAAPSALRIRKDGSTSFPYFTTDNQYKKLAALKMIHQCDEVIKLGCGSSAALLELLERYHVLILYAIHERQQPNPMVMEDGRLVSKARTAATEEEARSGSYEGKTLADMTAYDRKGRRIDGHFAMRRRDVFGMCGPLNYFLTAVFGCFREVYLTRFAFTYKTRDRADKKEKIKRFKYVLGSDVKTMDKLIPEWFSEYVFDRLPKYLDEGVVTLARRAYRAPYVVPPPWRKTSPDYNPVFGGSPLEDTSFEQHVGLPSGIAFNPDWGKLWMTFVYVILYRDCGALRTPSELEYFLRGKNPDHALLDMSDDAAFLTNSPAVAKRLEIGKSPYAVLEQEKPVIYLGDVFCEVSGEKEVYPNPLTYAINAIAREDSIDRMVGDPAKVVAWAEGYLARYQTYSATPVFREMNAILEEEMRREFGVNPYLIARSLAKHQRLNEIDALVKANPSVIHYKVDPKTVSKEVLNDIVATIPAKDIWPHIKHLFKVPTVDYEEVENE